MKTPQLKNQNKTNFPVKVYSPDTAIRHPLRLLREMAADLNAGRELAWQLFTRDQRAQYRKSYLGYIWAILPPLVASVTFIFLQSQGITNIQGTSLPYPAFAMIGTLLWQTFVDAISSPLRSVTAAKAMLTKVNFPREALLLSGVYMVIFNFLIRLLLMIVVMAVWNISPGMSFFFFPIAVLGLLLGGLSIGLALLPFGALYDDVGRAIPIAAQFGMLLTPVVYPARTSGLAGWLTNVNPIAPFIDAARSSLSGGSVDNAALLLGFTCIAIFCCTLGMIVFRMITPHLIPRMGG